MATAERLEFEGTPRFEIRRRLGAGGMGVVYEAYDRERDSLVALKTLATVDAGGVYRLKREFRSLAETSHPNLVVLHELVSAGDRWFFTMDLVDGVDFLSWVRTGANPRAAATLEMTPPSAGALDVTHERATGSFDERKLRAALRQLAGAVHALHQAGKLHRDIKPSNVMVSPDGHVTVLDFGLVSEESETIDLYATLDDRVVGTPAYMAPEQAAGKATSPASDWYAIGVMLYEALTGVLPFAGSIVHVLAMKQLRDPPPPADVVRDLPDDLVRLAMMLLRREPGERPSGGEILDALEHGAAPTAPTFAPPPREAPELVGRDAQLATLAGALGEARERGAPALVSVSGASGLGKTALVQHFLDRLREEGSAVVLTGKCYERETVAFKVLDTAIDSLSRYLRRLSACDVTALLPRDVHALARLFPVLGRVPAVESAPGPSIVIADAQELRRRAFGAFKELLARIADRQPLVVFVDDLQWADPDSAALVCDLLRPPDAPAALIIGAWRSEDSGSPLLRMLGAADEVASRHRITLGRLSREEATKLARALLDEGSFDDSTLANDVARESEGSPFFVGELARQVLEQRAAGETPVVKLTHVITKRIERLPGGARALLEAICVAGGPIETTIAVRAAKLGRDAPGALVALRAAKLVRSQGTADRAAELLETYHDRVRETVVLGLSEGRLRKVHRRLARALMAQRAPDPEALAVHLEGAGEREEAGVFARDAAAEAAEALAFDRAVRLYRRALSLRPGDSPERWQIEEALADALANAGRSAEAAAAYMRAAEGAGERAHGLRLRAGEHLLRSGHVDRGLHVAERVLAEVGMEPPKSPRRAFLSVVVHRGLSRVRGYGFEERREGDVPPAVLRRIDAAWSMAAALSMIDPIRGAELQSRHLKLALEAGEPYRAARAIALEAAHIASTGRTERATAILDEVEPIVARVGNPHGTGVTLAMRSTCAFFAGDWPASFEHGEAAEAIFRERCTNVAWERATTMRFVIVSLFYQGKLGELARRVPPLVAYARERDDLFAHACAASGCASAAWLAADDVRAAEASLRELESHLSHAHGYLIQHHEVLQGWTYADLYAGRAAEAWERMRSQWSSLEDSLLLRLPMLRDVMRVMRASSALAAGEIAAAESDAKGLAGSSVPWSRAMGRLTKAGSFNLRGRAGDAASELGAAATELDAQRSTLYAAAARFHRGSLVGGEEGRAERAHAEAAFGHEDVKSPEALAHTLCPGFRR